MKNNKNQNDCGEVETIGLMVEVVQRNWFVFAFRLLDRRRTANLNLKSLARRSDFIKPYRVS